MRVLLVDDDAALAGQLRATLSARNMSVDLAEDGSRALALLELTEYSVAVVDRNLPGISGEDVCQYIIQTWPGTKILMISGDDAVSDSVAGLSAGADDYISKPFELEELVARIVALDRRSGQARQPVLRGAGITLDPMEQVVTRFGEPIKLTAKEFTLLSTFMKSPSSFLSQDQLIERAWANSADSRPTSLRVTIGRLRAKIGSPDPIQTVKGLGYRFDPTVGSDHDTDEVTDEPTQSDLLVKARQQFVSQIDHELRGPLARIYLATEAMEQQFADQPEVLQGVQQVLDAARDLRRMLQAVVLMERSLYVAPTPVDVNFSAMVRITQLSIAPVLTEMKIVPTVELESGVHVLGDRGILLVLINNIMRNAVRHSYAEGSYGVRLFADDQWAVLEVSNSGGLFREELLEAARVRSEAARLQPAGQLTAQGSGLSMILLTTEMMGGRVTFQPRPEGGLEVVLQLPLSPAAS